ncbi:MAG: hypothetical protein NZ733_05815, partial [Aigarchaeota archaeon]|nr:hypothetical protein [Aigarchaeota archaeon]
MGLVVGDTERGMRRPLSDPLYSSIDLRGGGYHFIYVRESRPLLCAVPWLADARLEGVPVIDERMRITGMITHDEILHAMKTGEDEVKKFFLRVRVEEVARPTLVFSLHDELKRVIAELMDEKQTVGVVVNSAGFPITTVSLCSLIKSLLNHEPLRSLLSEINGL